MAEVFRIAAGAAGIVPHVTQTMSGIKTLRRIQISVETAANRFNELIGDLESLQHALERVKSAEKRQGDGGSSHPAILQQCRRDCGNVLAGL